MKEKKAVIFDLWETLISGAEDSAISVFYNEITSERISLDQLKNGMLINESEPRLFLEKFLNIVTPANISSMLLGLKNPRSPLYEKIIKDFNKAVADDSREIRWLPGAVELLEILKDKYKLVLVSNLWAYQKKYFFDNLDIGKYFDRCLFSCDLGMNKNHILNNIGRLLNIGIEDAVYVGRSYEYDIVPAVNAHISALMLVTEKNIILPEKTRLMIEEELNDGPVSFKTVTVAPKEPSVLTVIPPFYKLLGSHNNRLNLSASHLSAYLSHMGYKNKVYHCDSELKETYITRYQMVFNSIGFYDALKDYELHKEFENYYKNETTDVVFITCGDLLNPSFDSGNWDSSGKVAKIVRKINPKAYIIAIGPDIGLEPEDFDLLVYGEIEPIVEDILRKRIRGRISTELFPEDALKKIPNFDIKNLVTPVSPASLDTIIWRRGCSGRCDFCQVANINKGITRYRPMELLMAEIRQRYDDLNIRNFYLVDANFTSDRNLGIEFCRSLKREFPDISWRTESRFDTLNKDLLFEMKDAGCTHIKLGLENTLHEKHQVKTKRVTFDSARNWIKVIQEEIGLSCILYLMLGGKWFTHEQYRQMYKNAEELNATGYTVSLFTPYPNTPAGISYEEWKRRRFIGSHLDIRLIDFWRIPIDIIDAFFSLELKKGREDKDIREFVYQEERKP